MRCSTNWAVTYSIGWSGQIDSKKLTNSSVSDMEIDGPYLRSGTLLDSNLKSSGGQRRSTVLI